jgi:hypothetical protein
MSQFRPLCLSLAHETRNHLRIGRIPNPEQKRKRRTHSLCPSILRALQKKADQSSGEGSNKSEGVREEAAVMCPTPSEGIRSLRKPLTEGSFVVPTIGSILKSNRVSVQKMGGGEIVSNQISLFKEEEKDNPRVESKRCLEEDLSSEPSSIDISEQEVGSLSLSLSVSFSPPSQLEQALGISSMMEDINRGTPERAKFRLSWI